MNELVAAALKDGSIVGALVVLLFIVKAILPVIPKGNGNGNGMAISIARIEKDISSLQSMKEVIDGISEQIFTFSKDHAEFVQKYTEKHAQLSERIARLEVGK